MGGFTFDQIDDMTKSAISEIGNMISGNATTIFFNQGIKLNITTPEVIENTIDLGYAGKQVASVKINIDNIGELDIHVLL
jgi:chemotaxis protein CheX